MHPTGKREKGGASARRRPWHWWLMILGLAFLAAGAILFLVPMADSEKPHQLLVAGHWLDVPWELGLPALVLGGALLLAGLWRALRGPRTNR
jgi:hypothetical protein